MSSLTSWKAWFYFCTCNNITYASASCLFLFLFLFCASKCTNTIKSVGRKYILCTTLGHSQLSPQPWYFYHCEGPSTHGVMAHYIILAGVYSQAKMTYVCMWHALAQL